MAIDLYLQQFRLHRSVLQQLSHRMWFPERSCKVDRLPTIETVEDGQNCKIITLHIFYILKNNRYLCFGFVPARFCFALMFFNADR